MATTAFAAAVPAVTCTPCAPHVSLRVRRCALRRTRAPVRACIEPPQPPPERTAAPLDAETGAQTENVPRMSSAASSHASLREALADAASRALASLNGEPDVAIVFISARYGVPQVGPRGRESLGAVVPRLRALLPRLKAVIGCSVDGVVGGGEEYEAAPAVSLALLSLPAIRVRAFHVMPDDMPGELATTARWRSVLGLADAAADTSFLVLSDAAFAERGDLNRLLAGAHASAIGARAAGCVASAGAAHAGGSLLCTLPRDVLDPSSSALRDSGAVVLALEGDVELQPLVASCMRAVGPVFTACGGVYDCLPDLHVVGRPNTRRSVVDHLRSVLEYATPEERRLILSDVYVGVADPDAAADGSYVMRRVSCVDMDAGVVTTRAVAREGQSVRFFVRDVDAAQQALEQVLQRYKRAELAKSLVGYANAPFAALVFSDPSRGSALYRAPGVETALIANFVPAVPIAGCFSRAQIAPARPVDSAPATTPVDAGRSVVHHAASVIVLLRRRSGIDPLSPSDSAQIS